MSNRGQARRGVAGGEAFEDDGERRDSAPMVLYGKQFYGGRKPPYQPPQQAQARARFPLNGGGQTDANREDLKHQGFGASGSNRPTRPPLAPSSGSGPGASAGVGATPSTSARGNQGNVPGRGMITPLMSQNSSLLGGVMSDSLPSPAFLNPTGSGAPGTSPIMQFPPLGSSSASQFNFEDHKLDPADASPPSGSFNPLLQFGNLSSSSLLGILPTPRAPTLQTTANGKAGEGGTRPIDTKGSNWPQSGTPQQGTPQRATPLGAMTNIMLNNAQGGLASLSLQPQTSDISIPDIVSPISSGLQPQTSDPSFFPPLPGLARNLSDLSNGPGNAVFIQKSALEAQISDEPSGANQTGTVFSQPQAVNANAMHGSGVNGSSTMAGAPMTGGTMPGNMPMNSPMQTSPVAQMNAMGPAGMMPQFYPMMGMPMHGAPMGYDQYGYPVMAQPMYGQDPNYWQYGATMGYDMTDPQQMQQYNMSMGMTMGMNMAPQTTTMPGQPYPAVEEAKETRAQDEYRRPPRQQRHRRGGGAGGGGGGRRHGGGGGGGHPDHDRGRDRRYDRGYRGQGREGGRGPGGHGDRYRGGHPDNSIRDFHRHVGANWTLGDLVKKEMVDRWARDQHGSRFIQHCLENATTQEKIAVFKQIEKNALSLCEDVFGNYVIQKLFEHGTEPHKIHLARILIGRVLPLTKSMYGCRVIQKAFECVPGELRVTLVNELQHHVEECVRDQNGNHVIQKAIETVNPEDIDFIVSTFYGKVHEFSTHPYGCRVIQRLLERCTTKQKIPLLREIAKQIPTLAKDQYGNYVVQHVLRHGTPSGRQQVIQAVSSNILQMSKHKFSSNVVEVCFKSSSDDEREILIDAVLGVRDENPPLIQMVRDQYGNYVIQTILESTSKSQRTRVIGRIMELVPNLRKLMFGKHIIAKIERITGQKNW